jgi:hypothetical protein
VRKERSGQDGSIPAAIGRRHPEETVTGTLGHNHVRLDGYVDDAGRGHGGGEGDDESKDGLHRVGSIETRASGTGRRKCSEQASERE